MSLPKHIAFIMDGNGRWGQSKKQGRNFGHLNGVKVIEKIVKYSLKKKLPILTFYVFSTENWSRPIKEIRYLFTLIKSYFENEILNLIKNGVRIQIFGDISRLPLETRKILKSAIKSTKRNKKITVNLCINYGSKKEIVRSVNKSFKSNNKFKISEKKIEKNLYLSKPEPDILIRTGGMRRLSNFMLWQLSYTELFFLDKLWPDFNEKDLNKIVNKFKMIKRNYGSI